jgi:uncharacterized protein (UPF0248 family)
MDKFMVHGKKKKERKRIIIIKRRNGAKTISLQTCEIIFVFIWASKFAFGLLNSATQEV